MNCLFRPIRGRSLLAASALVLLSSAVSAQSADDVKARKAEARAEEIAARIEAEMEAWAERFSQQMDREGDALGRSIEQAVLKSLGNLGDLDLGDLPDVGAIDGWANRYAVEWEAWGEAQESLWEGWGQAYAGDWEDWASELEGLDPQSEAFHDLLAEGLAKNLAPLQHLPWSGLSNMPLIPGLQGLPGGSPLDGEELGEMIRRSIEGSLSGLEGLEGLRGLSVLGELEGVTPAQRDEVREHVLRSLESLRDATRGLHSSVWADRSALREHSDVEWKILEEVLEGLHSGDDGGYVIDLRDPRSGQDLSRKIEARIRERLESLRGLPAGAEKTLVEKLKSERDSIDDRNRELEELRRQVDALKSEVDRLRVDSKSKRSGRGAML